MRIKYWNKMFNDKYRQLVLDKEHCYQTEQRKKIEERKRRLMRWREKEHKDGSK